LNTEQPECSVTGCHQRPFARRLQYFSGFAASILHLCLKNFEALAAGPNRHFAKAAGPADKRTDAVV